MTTEASTVERPPVPGWSYAAFVVHPLRPGPVVLAIAHCEGTKLVLDVLRENITIEECCGVVKRYGIWRVTGAREEGDSLAHATLGALLLARQAQHGEPPAAA
jgi:hypothetical protein